MYFAETIIRNPGATFEARAGAAAIDGALIAALLVALSLVWPGGPLVTLADIPADGALTSRYGFDLFGLVRVNLETFDATGAPPLDHGFGASLLSWGRAEIVVSLTGALIALAAGFAYYVYAEGTLGYTLGKALFGTRVRDDLNRPIGLGGALARNAWKLAVVAGLVAAFVLANAVADADAGVAGGVIATVLKLAALLAAFLAFAVAAFSYRNRALHDMLAGTRVLVPSA